MGPTEGDRPPLTPESGQTSLRDHVAEKAAAAHAAHGPVIDYPAMLGLLEDRRFVRYPVRLSFDAGPLRPGEFAWAAPVDGDPAKGYVLHVHPHFADDEEALPLLIAYHLVVVNYGEIVTHEEAELFGATLLGLDVDDYYRKVASLADSIPGGLAGSAE